MVWILDGLRNAWRFLFNLLTRLPGPAVDYVIVDLAGSYPERRPPARPLLHRLLTRPWQPQEESLEAMRERLEHIAAAPQVRGVVLRPGGVRAGMATVQSLREAIAGLRRRGKRVVAYLPGTGLPEYYLATAADEIWMPAAGFWKVLGMRLELTFFRRAFDRAGLLPEFERIAEYKTAVDPFMREGLSAAHREVLEAILDGMMREVTTDVAVSRRLDAGAVRDAIDRAPLEAAEARAAGLIDGVCYEDELPARFGSPGRPAGVVPWAQAARRLPLPYRWRARTARVGVVQLVGAIVTGESRELPVPLPRIGSRFAGSETVARAFRAAERHPGIRAVVFHVESGGGSAVASDLILREVERIKRRKPVVVFMGNVAGSGGYYVACRASRIVLHPAAITGSIGVLEGKITVGGLFDRLGLVREIVARGAAVTMESFFQPYTADHVARIRREIEAIYRRFVGLVAAARGRPEAEIEAVARGRVWTGRQALEHGLVDELGDFPLAVRRAAELAGIPPGQPVEAVTIHPPRAVGIPASGGPAAGTLEALRALAGLAAEGAVLMIDPPLGG